MTQNELLTERFESIRKVEFKGLKQDTNLV